MAILVRLSGGRWGGAWAAQTESVHQFLHERFSVGSEYVVNIATALQVTEPSHDRKYVREMFIVDATAEQVHIRAGVVRVVK